MITIKNIAGVVLRTVDANNLRGANLRDAAVKKRTAITNTGGFTSHRWK
jgi:hypothetical protein